MSDPLQTALAKLPHGPEFRFLDRLIELHPGHSATAEYMVRGDEPFLAGHFPGEPLFPGVLLLEAGAQLAGVIAQSTRTEPTGEQLRLTAARAVKILGSARPGQTVRIAARLLARMEHLVQAEVSCSVKDTQVLQAEVTLSQARRSDRP
jgi:3-hydroxyacyl-[acyl-carrier-protein] dehydratase